MSTQPKSQQTDQIKDQCSTDSKPEYQTNNEKIFYLSLYVCVVLVGMALTFYQSIAVEKKLQQPLVAATLKPSANVAEINHAKLESSAEYMRARLHQLKTQQVQTALNLKQLETVNQNLADVDHSTQTNTQHQDIKQTAASSNKQSHSTQTDLPFLPIGHNLDPEVIEGINQMTHQTQAGTSIEHFADGTSMVNMGENAFRAVPVATIGKDGSIFISEHIGPILQD